MGEHLNIRIPDTDYRQIEIVLGFTLPQFAVFVFVLILKSKNAGIEAVNNVFNVDFWERSRNVSIQPVCMAFLL